jgi:SAM-dependent methyltransferase
MTPGRMPSWEELTEEQAQRWGEVLDTLVRLLPGGRPCVVVDGVGPAPAMVADRLAAALQAVGRPCACLTDTTPIADEDAWRADRRANTVALAGGPRWRAQPPSGRWDVTIWLRTAPGRDQPDDGEGGADVVIDLHDSVWPVIRHVTARLADESYWYVAESRAFFAIRAATWDTRFGDDLPAYAAAVADAGLPTGGIVVDVGCGTGRALPALRAAVGPTGAVLGLDLTPQMLAVARERGHGHEAALVLADARHLPLAHASVDAIFAAGLLTHLPDTGAGLRELARVTRPGGRLVLFHPSGRAALAARRGRVLSPDEPLAESPLRRSLDETGWRLLTYDDPPHRFFALATRQ